MPPSKRCKLSPSPKDASSDPTVLTSSAHCSIEYYNALSPSTYIAQLLPKIISSSTALTHNDHASIPWPMPHHSHDQPSCKELPTNLSLSIKSSSDLSNPDFQQCFDLVEQTSKDAYVRSSIGWKPGAKRREMNEPHLYYVLLYGQSQSAPDTPPTPPETPDTPKSASHTPHMEVTTPPLAAVSSKNTRVLGFYSFMLTYEDSHRVIYLYEIHLSPILRGYGLGTLLMEMFEQSGQRAGVVKAMLTMFVENISARGFYERRGYGVDEFSPRPRKMRGGRVRECDYIILSKNLRGRGAGEVIKGDRV